MKKFGLIVAFVALFGGGVAANDTGAPCYVSLDRAMVPGASSEQQTCFESMYTLFLGVINACPITDPDDPLTELNEQCVCENEARSAYLASIIWCVQNYMPVEDWPTTDQLLDILAGS